MIFETNIDVYNSKLYTILNEPLNGFIKICKEKGCSKKYLRHLKNTKRDRKSYKGVCIYDFDEEPRIVVIHIPNYSQTVQRDGVLVHELFHAVHCLLDYFGMDLTHESVESYTYLIEYLYVNVLCQIVDHYEALENEQKTAPEISIITN